MLNKVHQTEAFLQTLFYTLKQEGREEVLRGEVARL